MYKIKASEVIFVQISVAKQDLFIFSGFADKIFDLLRFRNLVKMKVNKLSLKHPQALSGLTLI